MTDIATAVQGDEQPEARVPDRLYAGGDTVRVVTVRPEVFQLPADGCSGQAGIPIARELEKVLILPRVSLFLDIESAPSNSLTSNNAGSNG